ncbi:LPS export ABC transporter periplasmic protein LptC [Chitinilyticum piscinae]|uniref:LPS export ABC transporter periplasmic protein LptC n=1 Tax=Chitinilyticum piscinae TaxID=2866724 RepID=A0A8J7G377_9NEIS|nr:LPS export ABC transporter periplasmic protein LptC [Chitinilyticum piscinae]MBE9610538.1 LPS export ABC transporter periplasmic protein LptC [Chitinilyticum piscinae]
MRDRIVNLLPLLLASVLAGLVYLLNQFSVVTLNAKKSSPELVDMRASSVTLVRLDASGLAVSRLQASTAEHVPLDEVMYFDAPRLVQTKPGEPQLTVEGVRARTIRKGDEAWFYGNVVLTRAASGTAAELVVRGSEIWVDQVKQLARSGQFVTADQGPHHLESVGFVADHRQQTLDLLSKVKMTYVPTARAALGGNTSQ